MKLKENMQKYVILDIEKQIIKVKGYIYPVVANIVRDMLSSIAMRLPTILISLSTCMHVYYLSFGIASKPQKCLDFL